MTVRRANRRPTVMIDTAAQTVDGGASVSLDATASDPDGDPLDYSWSGSGSFEDEESLDTKWTAPAAQSSDRRYTLTVTVSDGSLSADASVSITVRRRNRDPTIDPGQSLASYPETVERAQWQPTRLLISTATPSPGRCRTRPSRPMEATSPSTDVAVSSASTVRPTMRVRTTRTETTCTRSR